PRPRTSTLPPSTTLFRSGAAMKHHCCLAAQLGGIRLQLVQRNMPGLPDVFTGILVRRADIHKYGALTQVLMDGVGGEGFHGHGSTPGLHTGCVFYLGASAYRSVASVAGTAFTSGSC